MEVTIKMDNLQSIIEDAAKRNTQQVIEEYVSQKTKSILERDYASIIEEEVTSKLREYISTYIESFQIAVGGGFSGTDIQYMTPREYINKIISDTFRDKKFTVQTENYYGNKTKKDVTFEEFIKEFLNPAVEIKSQMASFAKGVKQEVNALLKNEYNKALQSALSGVVMDVIMENESFRNINNSIKRLSE